MNEAIRILSVDDRDSSPDERAALESRLEAWVAGVEFVVAASHAEMEEQLALESEHRLRAGSPYFSTILLALDLAWASGEEVLTDLADRFPSIPVVLLAEEGGEDDCMDALRLGATDLVARRGPYSQRLGPAVLSAIGRCRLLAEVAEKRQHLERLLAAEQESRTALEQQAAQLHEDDRRKDEFIAILGHELRNPLAVIDSHTRLMRGPCTGEFRERALREIGEQVSRLARLLDDLVDVSRISRGSLTLELEHVDFRQIVQDASDAVLETARARGHDLQVTTGDDELTVLGDPVRLGQVIVNLLTNAIKYTPNDGRIRVASSLQDETVEVVVEDNGLGITEETRRLMFEPFQRGDRRLGALDGLGVGLTVVQRLVALHGGSIHAQSEGPGTGSRFVVRLPLAEVVPETAPADEGTVQIWIGGRILVVDDNSASADAMSELLLRREFLVQTAYNGASALEIADEFQPQAALLDLDLPDTTGYDLAVALRQRLPEILLIAVTGFGQEEARRRTAEAGFDHHLLKPVDFRRLLSLLHP